MINNAGQYAGKVPGNVLSHFTSQALSPFTEGFRTNFYFHFGINEFFIMRVDLPHGTVNETLLRIPLGTSSGRVLTSEDGMQQ